MKRFWIKIGIAYGVFLFGSVTAILLTLLTKQPFGVCVLVSLMLFMVTQSYTTVVFVNYTNKFHVRFYKATQQQSENDEIVFRKNRDEELLFLCEYRDGLWSLTAGQVKWELDLEDYTFPTSYICAFVARQILYRESKLKQRIFVGKSGWFRYGKSQYFDRRNVKNIRMRFLYGERKKDVWVLKRGRIMLSHMAKGINSTAHTSLFPSKYYGASMPPIYLGEHYSEKSFAYAASFSTIPQCILNLEK